MFQAPSVRNNKLATRADASRLLLELTSPLLSHFSPGRAQVNLGIEAAVFGRKAAWLEGFARPLWGLAPLQAGGGAFDHWELFREGIKSGTDPYHPEFWGHTTGPDQRSVEMAPLGFALALAPEQLWQGLDAKTKANLGEWLGRIQSTEMVDNNWHFFPVIAGLGLERIGLAADDASRAQHLDRIETFYRANGWYGDGSGGHIDHYNGFALHFYGLIYARHRAGADPRRAAAYLSRATEFAQGFKYWFGADGAALVQGRSLTYRFACAAFWGALAYANLEALPWGEIRGFWGRHLRWWLQQPIFDPTGILTVGYRWPNYLMSEEYNSPGSPYWAFKAFLPLALPTTHPFWTAEEEEAPADSAPTTIEGASLMARRENGDVIALTAGPPRLRMRGAADKYAKFAYSTRFGLCVEAANWLGRKFCGDNILAFGRDRQHFSTREKNTASRVGDGFLETTWAPIPEARIVTLQTFVAGWEVRVHWIRARQKLFTVESGHAVPSRCEVRHDLKRAFASDGHSRFGIALAISSGHYSAICDIFGVRQALALNAAPNTSLVFPYASVPVLACRIESGEHVFATAVRAFHDPAGTTALGPVPTIADLAPMLVKAKWPATALSRRRSDVAPVVHEERYPVVE